MPRKIDIKQIENIKRQRVTFSKRRTGLLKKAKELATVCDAEVAVIIFSSSGKPYDFAISCMEQILARYNTTFQCSALISTENAADLHGEQPHVNALKLEIAKLQLMEIQMMGEQLVGLSFEQLQQLEHKIHESILAVRNTKQVQLEQHEKLIMQLFGPETSHEQGQCGEVQENEKIQLIDADGQGEETKVAMSLRGAKRRSIVEDVEESEEIPLNTSKREEIRKGKQKMGEADHEEAQKEFDMDSDTDIGEGPSKANIFISHEFLEAIANLNNTLTNLESCSNSHEAFIRESFDHFEMKIEDFEAKLRKKVEKNDKSAKNDGNNDRGDDESDNDGNDNDENIDARNDDKKYDNDHDSQAYGDDGNNKGNDNQDMDNETQDQAKDKIASGSAKDKSKSLPLEK